MLISNPFANPDFPGTVRLVAAILGGALPLLVAGTRFNLRGLLGNVLFQRWLVWACIAPVYGLAVFAGPLPTALLAGLMCVQGLREYSALVGLSVGYRRVLLLAGVLAPAVALLSLDGFYWLPPLLL